MRKLIEKINIPEFFDGWDQDQGRGEFKNPYSHERCCFGARLSYFFLKLKDIGFKKEYQAGRDWFYNQTEKLGWSQNQVNYAFYMCGADLNPFGVRAWRLPCKQVLQNLQKMEKPPTKEQFINLCKIINDYDYDYYLKAGLI